MTTIATDAPRLSDVIKYEQEPALGICRDVLTAYDAAATWNVGAVLGKFIASPTGTAGAAVGDGDGAIGTITVTSNANLELGVYKVVITKAVANAGEFNLVSPSGVVVGTGTVAVAFSAGGIAFTLADGTTDFALGTYIPITVAGTEKYKLVEATATDGSEVAKAIYISDVTGTYGSLALAANTDTKVLAITRGKVTASKDGLSYGVTVNTTAEKDALYAQLKSLQIFAETSV